ncbi:hypothetical protein M378DRAFT_156611 [Amanita muscaria Koide BX008]|uniref:Uncharacterized protein n=1 Tax=Amanita muscaria (strain Koide BX008) TaxID=946122 RepID=A0A0C2XLR0_AMAMK|nr:hypothetical protein M378DRAFT_156611 [Amanita muscaria Koide BX008]
MSGTASLGIFRVPDYGSPSIQLLSDDTVSHCLSSGAANVFVVMKAGNIMYHRST